MIRRKQSAGAHQEDVALFSYGIDNFSPGKVKGAGILRLLTFLRQRLFPSAEGRAREGQFDDHRTDAAALSGMGGVDGVTRETASDDIEVRSLCCTRRCLRATPALTAGVERGESRQLAKQSLAMFSHQATTH